MPDFRCCTSFKSELKTDNSEGLKEQVWAWLVMWKWLERVKRAIRAEEVVRWELRWTGGPLRAFGFTLFSCCAQISTLCSKFSSINQATDFSHATCRRTVVEVPWYQNCAIDVLELFGGINCWLSWYQPNYTQHCCYAPHHARRDIQQKARRHKHNLLT